MQTVDVVILGFTAVLAAVGFRQGFIVGALSLAGFALGVFLGTRAVRALWPEAAASPYAPLLGVAAAFAVGVGLSATLEGVGTRVRRGLRMVPGLRSLDGLLGAVLAAALALGIAWLAGAVALQAPGALDLRSDVQRSAVLSRLNAVLPPSGPLLHAIDRIDPFPTVRGPAADVAPPRPAIARDPQVAAARGGVVRVLGTACGLALEGSGWIASGGLVVTNAHVVAGEQDPTVQLGGAGPRLAAQAVGFDARNDIAVLRVDGLHGAQALSLAAASQEGGDAAILGFPGNGPYDVRPARVASTRTVLTDDAYGSGPVRRSITTFRGRVRPGNSGGPLVDADGRVVATVFATSGRSRGSTGYGVSNDVVARLLTGPLRPTGTGACAP